MIWVIYNPDLGWRYFKLCYRYPVFVYYRYQWFISGHMVFLVNLEQSLQHQIYFKNYVLITFLKKVTKYFLILLMWRGGSLKNK